MNNDDDDEQIHLSRFGFSQKLITFPPCYMCLDAALLLQYNMNLDLFLVIQLQLRNLLQLSLGCFHLISLLYHNFFDQIELEMRLIKIHKSSAPALISRAIRTPICFAKQNVYHPCLSGTIQAQQTPLILNGIETSRDDTSTTTIITQLWNIFLLFLCSSHAQTNMA